MEAPIDFTKYRSTLDAATRKAGSSPTDTWIEEIVPAAISQAAKVASMVAEGFLFKSRGNPQIPPREVAEDVSGEQSRGALAALWSLIAPMLWVEEKVEEKEGLRHTLYEIITRATYYEFVGRMRGVGQVEPLTYATSLIRVRIVSDEVQELARRWIVLTLTARDRGLRQFVEASARIFVSQSDTSGMASLTKLLEAIKALTAEKQVPEDLTFNNLNEETLCRLIARAFFSKAQAELVDDLVPSS